MDEGEGKIYGKEQAHGGTDGHCAEAGRGVMQQSPNSSSGSKLTEPIKVSADSNISPVKQYVFESWSKTEYECCWT